MNITESIFDSLNKGETIASNNPESYKLREEAFATIRLLNKLNNSSDPEEIRNIFQQIAGVTIGEKLTIFPPFYLNSGRNLKLGNNVFINFNCTFLALGGITIDDNVLIGPGVKILSESHPLEISERHSLIPGRIHIKQNTWIGAGATILSGITIGENAVVAAGAMVTRDIPANTVVAGIPAKMVKSIN